MNEAREQKSCTLCTCVFHVCQSRSCFRPINDVKWPVVVVCTTILFVIFLSSNHLSQFHWLIVDVLLVKWLAILEHWFQKREATFSDFVVVPIGLSLGQCLRKRNFIENITLLHRRCCVNSPLLSWLQVTAVVNYDMPEEPTVYLHRICRTGWLGRNCIAVNLIDGFSWSINIMKKIEEHFGWKISLLKTNDVEKLEKGNEDCMLETGLFAFGFVVFLSKK